MTDELKDQVLEEVNGGAETEALKRLSDYPSTEIDGLVGGIKPSDGGGGGAGAGGGSGVVMG